MPNYSELVTAHGLGAAHAAYVEAYGNEKPLDWEAYAAYRRMQSDAERHAWKEAFCEGYDDYFADQD